MRTRIWMPCIIALVVCMLFLLWPKQHQNIALPVQNAAPTNQPNQTEQPKEAERHQISNVVRTVPLPPAATRLAEAVAKTNPYAGRVLALWQAPIDFYGKVVDENSNAIAGAQVSFHWMEIPAKDGSRSSNVESDSAGLFSLRGAVGPSLTVSVSKGGYYTSRSTPDGFHYSLENDTFHADSQNPVVFHLRKKGHGVELITSENGMRSDVWVHILKDNTPVRVDLLQKKVSVAGQLEISQNKPPWRDATNWSFRMSIPDGGFVENEDEFQFVAPETNYEPTIEYHFAKNETNWVTQVTKSFYIEFGQPRRYGWLRIESDLAQETIFLTYAINPTGSRNLEPTN